MTGSRQLISNHVQFNFNWTTLPFGNPLVDMDVIPYGEYEVQLITTMHFSDETKQEHVVVDSRLQNITFFSCYAPVIDEAPLKEISSNVPFTIEPFIHTPCKTPKHIQYRWTSPDLTIEQNDTRTLSIAGVAYQQRQKPFEVTLEVTYDRLCKSNRTFLIDFQLPPLLAIIRGGNRILTEGLTKLDASSSVDPARKRGATYDWTCEVISGLNGCPTLRRGVIVEANFSPGTFKISLNYQHQHRADNTSVLLTFTTASTVDFEINTATFPRYRNSRILVAPSFERTDLIKNITSFNWELSYDGLTYVQFDDNMLLDGSDKPFLSILPNSLSTAHDDFYVRCKVKLENGVEGQAYTNIHFTSLPGDGNISIDPPSGPLGTLFDISLAKFKSSSVQQQLKYSISFIDEKTQTKRSLVFQSIDQISSYSFQKGLLRNNLPIHCYSDSIGGFITREVNVTVSEQAVINFSPPSATAPVEEQIQTYQWIAENGNATEVADPLVNLMDNLSNSTEDLYVKSDILVNLMNSNALSSTKKAEVFQKAISTIKEITDQGCDVETSYESIDTLKNFINTVSLEIPRGVNPFLRNGNSTYNPEVGKLHRHIQNLLVVLYKSMLIGSEPFSLQNEKLQLLVFKELPSKLKNKELRLNDQTKIILPSDIEEKLKSQNQNLISGVTVVLNQFNYIPQEAESLLYPQLIELSFYHSVGCGNLIPIKGLEQSITLSFDTNATLYQQDSESSRIQMDCVYYNTSTSAWAKNGCRYQLENGSPSCNCTHTTDFALVYDVIAVDNNDDEGSPKVNTESLQPINYVIIIILGSMAVLYCCMFCCFTFTNLFTSKCILRKREIGEKEGMDHYHYTIPFIQALVDHHMYLSVIFVHSGYSSSERLTILFTYLFGMMMTNFLTVTNLTFFNIFSNIIVSNCTGYIFSFVTRYIFELVLQFNMLSRSHVPQPKKVSFNAVHNGVVEDMLEVDGDWNSLSFESMDIDRVLFVKQVSHDCTLVFGVSDSKVKLGVYNNLSNEWDIKEGPLKFTSEVMEQHGRFFYIPERNYICFMSSSMNDPLMTLSFFDIFSMDWIKENIPLSNGVNPCYSSAIAVHENNIYIFGGIDEKFQVVETFSYFDTEKFEWNNITCKDKPRRRTNAILHSHEGVLYLMGGFDQDHEPLNDCLYFNQETNQWMDVGKDLPLDEADLVLCQLLQGGPQHDLVAGFYNSSSKIIEWINLKNGSFLDSICPNELNERAEPFYGSHLVSVRKKEIHTLMNIEVSSINEDDDDPTSTNSIAEIETPSLSSSMVKRLDQRIHHLVDYYHNSLALHLFSLGVFLVSIVGTLLLLVGVSTLTYYREW
eukprot:CAMPEP_0117422664 /NCGR_PEP_ID=MMETSP0758-20121206/3465_1 /TAXON_ID=63605 /ORGANISM="Percolomonas cosmopolitus, Strain AE-1 (ATCC 50343)" /LENGTH=1337 /DNA_ID=CAMNT_0005205433 /DNA_START=336 /DNA_END=4347 /DNA_ORIENTATION=-